MSCKIDLLYILPPDPCMLQVTIRVKGVDGRFAINVLSKHDITLSPTSISNR